MISETDFIAFANIGPTGTPMENLHMSLEASKLQLQVMLGQFYCRLEELNILVQLFFAAFKNTIRIIK